MREKYENNVVDTVLNIFLRFVQDFIGEADSDSSNSDDLSL